MPRKKAADAATGLYKALRELEAASDMRPGDPWLRDRLEDAEKRIGRMRKPPWDLRDITGGPNHPGRKAQ